MSKIRFVLAAVGAAAILAAAAMSIAAELPEWAYPEKSPAVPWDAVILKQLPGSTKTFTQAQIEDNFNPPDWFPEDHPPMPDVVAHGRPPAVSACAKCHISNGAGHPESSDLAGLPPAYVRRQIEDFKNGDRHGARAGSMIPFVKAITDDEIRIAADYYAALRPVAGWTEVVETDTIPKTRVSPTYMRFAIEGAGTEPLGQRIIELPKAPERAELRDSRFGFIAHVPRGSIAAGKALVTGSGKTPPCGTCHGNDLKGNETVPHIVGRSPSYMFRQMYDVKNGSRNGPHAALMKEVVADLDDGEMLAIAAYLAAQRP
jgi:cytochrome c553